MSAEAVLRGRMGMYTGLWSPHWEAHGLLASAPAPPAGP